MLKVLIIRTITPYFYLIKRDKHTSNNQNKKTTFMTYYAAGTEVQMQTKQVAPYFEKSALPYTN